MRYSMPVDRKGPRFRKAARNVLNQQFYRKLKKELPDLAFSIEEIRKVIYTFHQECVEIIATTRDGLELPNGLGFIIVNSHETCLKHFHPDAQNYYNWDTNRRMCKIYYTNYPVRYRFRFSFLWGFKPGRQMKKAVSQSFKKNYHIFHITRSWLVSRVFRKKNHLEGKIEKIHKRLNKQQDEHP